LQGSLVMMTQASAFDFAVRQRLLKFLKAFSHDFREVELETPEGLVVKPTAAL